MDPFFLTFVDPALERYYHRRTTSANPNQIDDWYWWFALTIRLAALVKFASYLGPWTCWPAYLYIAWLLIEALVRWRLNGRNRLWLWRTPLVIVSRLFTTLEIGTGSANFVSAFLTFGSEDLPTRLPLIALSFIMSQGLLTMTFLGLFQPLSFRFHFPLQLCASAFLLSTLGLEVCRQTGTGGIPRTEWIFEELDAVVTWTTVPFAKLCEQLLLGADKYPWLQTVTWLLGRLRDGLVLKVEYPCLQMAMFLQGYVGFGVISYFVWLSERRSRVIFIQRLRSDVRPTEPIKPLDWSAVFRHTFYFFAAYVILWKIFLIFAPRIINWGM